MFIVNKITTFIKGFIIGTSMLIPGMSGGTMAVILNVFDELVSLLSNIKKHFKENIGKLLIYGISIGLGLILLAKPVLILFETYPFPSYYFFVGAIIGTLPVLFSKFKGEKIKPLNLIFLALGILIALSIMLIPKNVLDIDLSIFPLNSIYFLLIGFIIAIAMVLPGISGSYILLIFGLYEKVLTLISDIEVYPIIFMGIGAVIGIFSLAKILDKEISRHPQATYLFISGFLIGSLFQIFPGIKFSPEHLLISFIPFLTLILGFLVVFTLFLFSKNKR